MKFELPTKTLNKIMKKKCFLMKWRRGTTEVNLNISFKKWLDFIYLFFNKWVKLKFCHDSKACIENINVVRRGDQEPSKPFECTFCSNFLVVIGTLLSHSHPCLKVTYLHDVHEGSVILSPCIRDWNLIYACSFSISIVMLMLTL